MQTIVNFSFRAKYAEQDDELDRVVVIGPANPWIMSAGRWENHAEAVKAASHWLACQADNSPSMFAIEIVTVEELELIVD